MPALALTGLNTVYLNLFLCFFRRRLPGRIVVKVSWIGRLGRPGGWISRRLTGRINRAVKRGVTGLVDRVRPAELFLDGSPGRLEGTFSALA